MTPQEYRDFKQLSYSQMAKLIGCSKARAYDICLQRRGQLRIEEINNLLNNTDGMITPEDLGLEVTTC